MNVTRPLSWLVTVLLAAVLTLLVFGAGWLSSAYVQELSTSARRGAAARASEVLQAPAVQRTARDDVDLTVFWEAMDLLRSHFYGEVPDDAAVMYGAIRGVVASTNDPHTSFVDPAQAQLLEQDLRGEFDGIGARVEMKDNELIIVSTMPDSPAEQAGILGGDVVVTVDGEPIAGMTLNEAVTLIRGPRGSTVHLTIKREGQRDLLEFDIVRDRILLIAVESRLIEGEGGKKIGYLQLNDFSSRAPAEVKQTLRELKDQGMTALILDVRNNPGGYLSSAVDITSEFVGEGVILTERGSNGRNQVHRARDGGSALDIPLVVLVNEGSASASEILAGAVQDTERGTLIGTTTFGKGSVQVPHDLSDGSNLRVTIARWFTPEGRAIHDVGVTPDIVVELSPADAQAGRDPQLDRAISFHEEQE